MVDDARAWAFVALAVAVPVLWGIVTYRKVLELWDQSIEEICGPWEDDPAEPVAA